MQNKLAVYKIRGMNKDLSYSAFNPEFSWHNHNIRLTARDGNNLLSVTNEKGNVKLTTTDILGKVIGTCVIKDTLVVFTCDALNAANDRIYKVYGYNPTTNAATTTKLYEGTLGFSISNPIQGLPFYENETIQKVYWVDGKNQTRVINVMGSTAGYNNESFDFVKKLALTEVVAVAKSATGGLFKSGTVQYAMTYYNLNGSESNIFYISPLNYIAPAGRGGAPDEIVANSFSISATGLDTQFSYLRIYSIYRSSKDVISEVKRVVDLSIPASAALTYIDGNTSGSTLSSDVLLYIGGEELIAGCIGQKSNTMFLGNIKVLNNPLPLTLVASTNITTTVPPHSSAFSWSFNPEQILESSTGRVSYPYIPSLTNSSENLSFKHGETYRFGIQGQYDDGRWSTPIWLGSDKVTSFRYRTWLSVSDVMIRRVRGSYLVDATLSAWMASIGVEFKKVRPVMVPLTMTDRTVVAQGAVTNTLGATRNRKAANSGTEVFSYPDYFFRNNGKGRFAEDTARDGNYGHFDFVADYQNAGSTPTQYCERMDTGDSNGYVSIYSSGAPLDSEAVFVDRNVVNFWSPEIQYNESAISPYLSVVNKANLYGFAVQTGRKFDFNYEFTTSSVNGSFDFQSDVDNYSSSLMSAPVTQKVVSLHSADGSGGTYSDNDVIITTWMPEDIDAQIPYTGTQATHDIQMTSSKNEKSGFCYYGYNATLDGVGSGEYSLPINTPALINSSSQINFDLNPEHNGGSGLYLKDYSKIRSSVNLWVKKDGTWNPYNTRKSMTVQYNTANHILFSFSRSGAVYNTMPRLTHDLEDNAILTETYFNVPSGWYGTGSYYFQTWIFPRAAFSPLLDSSVSRNTVPIFDLCKDVSEEVRYGGVTVDAITSNNWIPCGPPVNVVAGAFTVRFTEGDTYIKRFDLKRVFPADLISQKPQHTEIVSFICESFVNTDGRYDTHREETNSVIASSYNNYGSVNQTYSQNNNYFNYTAINPLLFQNTEFPVTIAWSNVKTSGSVVDNWTNMTSARSLDLDGVYGAVSSINLINNDLYVFQPKGIARLLYNERISQKASDGLAIEVANGYKVPEYRYITNQYGCSNRDSIVEGKGGIYFIDFINKTLCSVGDGIKDLGYEKGFKSWFNTNVSETTPFTLSYDKMNNDLYIHNDIYCLNYSEVLQLFASFYDYVGIGRMRNIWGKNLSVRYDGATASGIWIHSDGAYNMFYNYQQPFSVEYTLSPEPTSDKVFNSFEYRLDNRDIDINQVEVTNWYQSGKVSSSQFASNMKVKFNVNRVLFPRDNNHTDPLLNKPLNRIRSTWAKLKISHVFTTPNVDKKFVMQDLAVSYSV